EGVEVSDVVLREFGKVAGDLRGHGFCPLAKVFIGLVQILPGTFVRILFTPWRQRRYPELSLFVGGRHVQALPCALTRETPPSVLASAVTRGNAVFAAPRLFG